MSNGTKGTYRCSDCSRVWNASQLLDDGVGPICGDQKCRGRVNRISTQTKKKWAAAQASA